MLFPLWLGNMIVASTAASLVLLAGLALFVWCTCPDRDAHTDAFSFGRVLLNGDSPSVILRYSTPASGMGVQRAQEP
jgi:hypothetical protein